MAGASCIAVSMAKPACRLLVMEMAEVNLFVLQARSGKDSMYVAKASRPFFFLLVAAVDHHRMAMVGDGASQARLPG